MSNSKIIDFKNENTSVYKIDGETLAINMGKPYVFITLKQYADESDSQNANFAPLMNEQD